jgi:vacuolar protein sorting-associated protein 13A/C
MFPVIMTPTKYKEIFEFDRPQLSLVIAQSTQAKTLTLIKSIRAWLQPTTIRLTSEVLENIYALFKNIQQQLKTNVNEESLNAQHDFEYALEFQLKKKTSIKDKENVIYMSNQVQSKYGQQHHQRNRVDTYDWLVAELPLQAKTTYIDRIEIYPLYFNITFYNSVHTSV